MNESYQNKRTTYVRHQVHAFWGVFSFVKRIRKIKARMAAMFFKDSLEYQMQNLLISAESLEKHVSILKVKLNMLQGALKKKGELRVYTCEQCSRQKVETGPET